jgi:farnesyl-diphosphate farnesyltransferase
MKHAELLAELLERTSRTFALAIPLLPEGLRHEVGLGYLLFRIADTLEDAERWDRDKRRDALRQYTELLAEPTEPGAERLAAIWRTDPPSTSTEYNRLLGHTPEVFAAVAELPPATRRTLLGMTARSAEGMSTTLALADQRGAFRLATIDDLRQYCYYVAGIVGEMLTELFRARLARSASADRLAEHAAAFGEGLQLVNILKDAGGDADQGRVYLPAGVARADVLALARQDLVRAEAYAELLARAGGDHGTLSFVVLPRMLAEATLDVLETGERTKLSRAEVTRIMGLAEGEVARLTGSGKGTPA